MKGGKGRGGGKKSEKVSGGGKSEPRPCLALDWRKGGRGVWGKNGKGKEAIQIDQLNGEGGRERGIQY